MNTQKFAGRRWVLLLAGSALAVVLSLAGCRGAASSGPTAAPESIRRALDCRVTAEFHDAPWPDVLAELSRQADVPLRLDRETILRERGWDVATWKATFKVREMRLQSALRLLTAAPGVMFVPRHDGITITAERVARPTAGASLVSRAYAVPPGLVGGGPDADQRHLAGVLRRMIEPDSWRELGGDGNVLSAPGALIVTQTPDNQRQVARLLTGLERVAVDRQSWSLEEAESLESPALRAACEALARPVSLAVDGQPLGVVLDRLAAEQNVNIVWHGFREGGVYLGLPVSLSVDACPLRGALDRLLVQHDLVAEVHDDAVVIRTAASAPPTATWRLYPTPDFDGSQDRSKDGARDAAELVTRHVSRLDWQAFGGQADIVTIPGGVAARCRWAVHEELDRFFAQWWQMERRVMPDGGHAAYIPKSAREEMLDTLVSLECHQATLAEIFRELTVQAGKPIDLSDDELSRTLIMGVTSRLTLYVRDVPLRDVLLALSNEHRDNLVDCIPSLVLRPAANTNHTINTKFYPLPGLLDGPERLDPARLVNLVESHVDSISWLGHPHTSSASIECTQSGIVATQSDEVHHELQRFLRSLRELIDRAQPQARETPFTSCTPIEARLYAALDAPVTVDVQDEPLAKVLSDLIESHGLAGRAIVDLSWMDSDEAVPDMRITMQVRDVPLAVALNEILAPRNLAWIIDNDMFTIGGAGLIEMPDETRCYPVPWAHIATDHDIQPGSLAYLVAKHNNLVAGYGVATTVSLDAGNLVITTARGRHYDIASMLEQLSEHVTGTKWTYQPPYSVATEWSSRTSTGVYDVRRWLPPQGPLNERDLIELITAALGDELARVMFVEANVHHGALVTWFDPHAHARLAPLLRNHDGAMDRVVALWKQTEEKRSPLDDLQAACLDPSPRVREYAFHALFKLGHDATPAMPRMVHALADPDPHARLAAISALRAIGPEASAALPAVVSALRAAKEEDEVEQLCSLLSTLGAAAEPAIPILLNVAIQGSAGRGSACDALGQIGLQPNLVVPVLMLLTADMSNFSVRGAACRALGEFGPRAAMALDRLQETMLTDSEFYIRTEARIAITQIQGHPPDVPVPLRLP